MDVLNDLQVVLKSYGYFGPVENLKDDIINYQSLVHKIIKFKQGDPLKVHQALDKTKHGFDFERPFYLYEDMIDKENPTKPNADILGFELAREFSINNNIPLVEVLPNGAKGLIILTGDDDQAYLEKYDEQIKVIKNFPITYFLHPLTKHTKNTIAKFNENVEFGIHPDALEEPNHYDQLTEQQLNSMENLVGCKMKSIRNHGYLSDGYQGHLSTWEKLGLEIDVNLPGVDGTALNGSYLPMRVKKEDGTWTEHYSLLTAFGDGMLFAKNLTQKEASNKIKYLAKQIENTIPGVLVFNFHPQNISLTKIMHEIVIKIAKRRGWLALTIGEYLEWLKILESLHIRREANGEVIIASSLKGPIKGLVLKKNDSDNKSFIRNIFCSKKVILPEWENICKVKV